MINQFFFTSNFFGCCFHNQLSKVSHLQIGQQTFAIVQVTFYILSWVKTFFLVPKKLFKPEFEKRDQKKFSPFKIFAAHSHLHEGVVHSRFTRVMFAMHSGQNWLQNGSKFSFYNWGTCVLIRYLRETFCFILELFENYSKTYLNLF